MPSTTLKTAKSGERFYEIRCHVSRSKGTFTRRWYVPGGWSEKAIQRELAKVSAEFERQCKDGEVLTRAEQKAQEAEAKRLADMEAAKIITVRQYAEKVFMPAKLAGTIGKKAISENSRAYYQNALDKHILPIIGNRPMQDITRADLEALLLGVYNSGKSASTISAVYITLLQLFNSAEDNETVSVSPMLRVKKPKHNKTTNAEKTPATYTADEVRTIIGCIAKEPLQWRTYMMLLIDTGCRRGEACGLRWRSIDFRAGTITIENNLLYTGEKGVFDDTPKTNASVRTIDLSAEVLDLLKQLRMEQASKAISQYVFTQKGSSEPMHPTSPTRYFKKFGKKYGIADFHPHKLRHTFASIAITNNADIASVSEKLGHANKAITLRMYTHADAESIKRAGDIFRDALKKANNE